MDRRGVESYTRRVGLGEGQILSRNGYNIGRKPGTYVVREAD